MSSFDTIKNILHDKLEIDPSLIQPESTIESLGIDSLDMVELICELEDTLDIDFGDPDNLDTIGDVASYVDSLR